MTASTLSSTRARSAAGLIIGLLVRQDKASLPQADTNEPYFSTAASATGAEGPPPTPSNRGNYEKYNILGDILFNAMAVGTD